MKNNASLLYNACLMVGDFLALIGAFGGAYILRAKIDTTPVAHPIHATTYIGVFLALLPFWILIFGLLGLYNSNIYEKRFSEFGRLLMGSFVGLLFVIFWNFVSVNPIFPSKLVPIYGFILAFVFLVIFRNLARFIRTQLFGYKVGLTNVLIVGNTDMSREIIDSLSDSRRSGYRVVAVVGGKRAIGNHRLPLYTRFSQFLKEHPESEASLHNIVQTELYADESRNAEILTYAQERHVGYRFVPGNTELFVGNIDVELFRNSIPVITVRQTALFGWGRIVKRLFDLAFASLLVVILSPVFLLIALIIKLSGGGTVFFRQARLTRFNQQFHVFKFHTQYEKYDGTPEEGFTKMGRPDLLKKFRANGNYLPNDPRVTPIGRFLRSTSLDELPQLLNVIKGDLSLVGPRALIPADLSEYKKRHTILSVKSGITGLAQISGRNNIPFEERRKLDLYYVQNWSFWLDIIILAKTFRALLTHEYDGK